MKDCSLINITHSEIQKLSFKARNNKKAEKQRSLEANDVKHKGSRFIGKRFFLVLTLNHKLILNKLYKRLLQTFVRLSLIFLSRNISHRRVISSTYCPIKILLLIFIEKYVFPLGSPISASFSWSTGLEKIAQIPLT